LPHVRLDDVARRARVSLSTASRVINDNGYPVAEATRQRVLDAVRDLNYSPSVLARALVTKRTQIIGVIVGDVTDPFFSEIVRGVEDVARRLGYLVIVCNADRDPATELSYLRALLGYRVDGVILAGGGSLDEAHREPHRQAVASLEHQGSVVVSLAEVPSAVPCFSIDNRAAAAALARHLRDLGHTRIAIIAGPERITTARARLTGVRDVLGPHGIPPEWLANGGFTVQGGECAADALLMHASRPTAIIALNDQMAVGAVATAHRLGLNIPADVSIVGFGDTTAARQTWPTLTTISVPRHELGALATTAILRQLDGGAPAASCQLDFTLTVRGTSGPPPARPRAVGPRNPSGQNEPRRT
jgi:LacI family transcriptional regulator